MGFWKAAYKLEEIPLIARFLGPTWGPPGADGTQVGPMLAPWISLSGTWRVQLMRISRIRGYGFDLFHFDHMFSFGYKKEDIRSSLILTSMEKFGLAHITLNYTSEMKFSILHVWPHSAIRWLNLEMICYIRVLTTPQIDFSIYFLLKNL